MSSDSKIQELICTDCEERGWVANLKQQLADKDALLADDLKRRNNLELENALLKQQLEAEQAGAASLREVLEEIADKCKLDYEALEYIDDFKALFVGLSSLVFTTADKALSTPAGAAMLERVKWAEESLNWLLNNLAIRDCEHDAEDSDETTPCTETGACITEYCLPCYARVIKKTKEASAK